MGYILRSSSLKLWHKHHLITQIFLLRTWGKSKVIFSWDKLHHLLTEHFSIFTPKCLNLSFYNHNHNYHHHQLPPLIFPPLQHWRHYCSRINFDVLFSTILPFFLMPGEKSLFLTFIYMFRGHMFLLTPFMNALTPSQWPYWFVAELKVELIPSFWSLNTHSNSQC